MATRIKRDQRKIHEATELAKLAVQLAQFDGKGIYPQTYLRDALDLILAANDVIKHFQGLIDEEFNDEENGGDNHGEEKNNETETERRKAVPSVLSP